MGAAALERRPGVKSVTRGWYGLSEVNHVEFDPEKVTVEQMIEWLKRAGTYIRTISHPDEEGNNMGSHSLQTAE